MASSSLIYLESESYNFFFNLHFLKNGFDSFFCFNATNAAQPPFCLIFWIRNSFFERQINEWIPATLKLILRQPIPCHPSAPVLTSANGFGKSLSHRNARRWKHWNEPLMGWASRFGCYCMLLPYIDVTDNFFEIGAELLVNWSGPPRSQNGRFSWVKMVGPKMMAPMYVVCDFFCNFLLF